MSAEIPRQEAGSVNFGLLYSKARAQETCMNYADIEDVYGERDWRSRQAIAAQYYHTELGTGLVLSDPAGGEVVVSEGPELDETTFFSAWKRVGVTTPVGILRIGDRFEHICRGMPKTSCVLDVGCFNSQNYLCYESSDGTYGGWTSASLELFTDFKRLPAQTRSKTTPVKDLTARQVTKVSRYNQTQGLNLPDPDSLKVLTAWMPGWEGRCDELYVSRQEGKVANYGFRQQGKVANFGDDRAGWPAEKQLNDNRKHEAWLEIQAETGPFSNARKSAVLAACAYLEDKRVLGKSGVGSLHIPTPNVIKDWFKVLLDYEAMRGGTSRPNAHAVRAVRDGLPLWAEDLVEIMIKAYEHTRSSR